MRSADSRIISGACCLVELEKMRPWSSCKKLDYVPTLARSPLYSATVAIVGADDLADSQTGFVVAARGTNRQLASSAMKLREGVHRGQLPATPLAQIGKTPPACSEPAASLTTGEQYAQSLSSMVTSAVATPSVAPLGLLSVTKKSSVLSPTLSPMMSTVIWVLTLPASIVTR